MSTPRTKQDAPESTRRRSLGSEPNLKTRGRLLACLERGAAWTMDLRREPEKYGANPADGVYELRKLGWDIRTLRAWTYDREGRPYQFRDYYALFQNSTWTHRRMRWEGGNPMPWHSTPEPWRAALLKAWEREL